MSSHRKLLYEVESPISGKIKVIQDGSERQLVVGGLNQSINADAPDVGERIWGVLAQTQNSNLKIQNSLILGLGGGTVAHLLTQKYGPIPIDAIEIDPLIVEIGKKFFDLDKLHNLNIIVGDAIEFVQTPRRGVSTNHQSYDLIIVDLYCGSKYPTGAESPSFLAGLARLAHPSGVVVFNRISDKKDLDFEESLRRSFGKFEKKLVPSKFGGENTVLVC